MDAPMNPESKKQETVEIHTMPDRYYLHKGKTKSSKGLVIALIIVVVMGLGLGAAYVLTRVINANTVNTNTPVTNVNAVNVVNAVNNAANANASQNTNGNTNRAANSNANTNTVANSNVNVNAVVNGVFNSNSQANLNTGNVQVSDSTDSDHDALTDVEETLYGTSATNADTDGDGFTDGAELMNGYSPRGTEKLSQTNLVKEYLHPTQGYKIYYPSSWVNSENPQIDEGRIFSTSTGELVSIDVQSNPSRLSARDWYIKQFPGVDFSKIQTISNTQKNLQGVLSLDGLTAYYTAGDKAYIIAYNINLLSAANFRTTFTMMYRSFQLSSILLGNSNTNTANANTARNGNTNSTNTSTNNTNTNTNVNGSGF